MAGSSDDGGLEQRRVEHRGPSRQRGRIRPMAGVGTTQPKQAPKPHAIPDSSASWAGTSRRAHSSLTASSIAGGPQA